MEAGVNVFFFFSRRRDDMTPGMDPLLKLLQENAAAKPGHLAKMLNLSEAEVTAKIKQYETERVILGYRAILNDEKMGIDIVRAVIEHDPARRIGLLFGVEIDAV